MNYIVFDLEWNQPDDGIPNSERKLLFEIIEIGAVKLNENLEIVSEFNQLIRPTVYHMINWRTWKMLNLTRAELKKGHSFVTVCKEFLDWCGEDVVYCTWGSQDLTELQRNMEYFGFKPLADGPISYLNIQKIFGVHIGEETVTKNLESAVDMMEIEKAIPFHRAYSDAYYTAKIMQSLGKKEVDSILSFDLYHIPTSRKNEISYLGGNEYYYVSKGYENREDLINNRKTVQITCAKCGNRPLRAKVRWFPTSTKNFYSGAICEEHGAIKGRMKYKKDQHERYYVDKILTYVDEEEIKALKEKKAAMKKKPAAAKNENPNENSGGYSKHRSQEHISKEYTSKEHTKGNSNYSKKKSKRNSNQNLNHNSKSGSKKYKSKKNNEDKSDNN